MRVLLILFLIAFPVFAFSQDLSKKDIIMEGYIFTEDSLPAENAHLINYRTSRIVTTDSEGYFRTVVQSGDSLMVNHVSLTPNVIYTGAETKGRVKLYIPYRTYILRAISSGNYEKEKENVDENMKQVKKDIANQIIVKPYHRTNENPYDNDKINPGITIPLLQLGTPEKKKPPTE